MKKTKRVFLISIALIAILMVVFLRNFFPIERISVKAVTCGDYNIEGWAWSENIGWLSFSCENCDSDYDGFTDAGNYAWCPVGQPIEDYGVSIDGNGDLFGYAWSDKIGWVTFNEGELAGCPSSPCKAVANTTTGEVSGWARALANSDGWDGWINLDGQTQGYKYRREIMVDHTQVDFEIYGTDFPVLVQLYAGNASDIFTECQESGYDIKFMDATGTTQLDHEIEYWNKDTAEFFAWVKLPQIYGSVTTSFYVYYGNPAETVDQSNPAGVWDSNYLAVYHLNGSDWRRTYDSTNNNNDAIGSRGNPSFWQGGRIGKSVYFDGEGDTLVFDQIFTNETSFTMEAWIKPLIPPDARYFISQWHTYGSPNRQGAFLQVWPDVPNYHGWWNNTTTKSVEPYDNDTWAQIVLTGDDTSSRIWKNGGEDYDYKTMPEAVNWPTESFYISDCSWGPGWRVFNGYIDEVRLSNVARTNSWIKTSYNTMNSTNFITVGSAESLSYTPSDYKVTIETDSASPDYQEFFGWAWGSDVVGWLSFNAMNQGAGNDYYVKTTESLVETNSTPTAAFVCTDPSNCGAVSGCIGYTDCSLIMDNNSTDTDPGDTLTSSWYIDSELKDSCSGISGAGICDFTPGNFLALPNYESFTTHDIRLYITDGQATDTVSKSYEHRREAVAGFRCSLDGNNWNTPCDDIRIAPGTVVYFDDRVLAYPDDVSYPSCCSNSIIERTWKANDVPFNTGNNHLASTTLNLLPATIELSIVDSNLHGGGKEDTAFHTIGRKSSTPSWIEVSP